MVKINYKAPKYVVPIIILPFLVLINWIILDSFPDAQATAIVENTETETYEINTNIPSPNLDKHDLKNKFESIKDAYKYSQDYTAIQEIEEEQKEVGVLNDSRYTNEEKMLIDSINNQILKGEKETFLEEIERRSKTSKTNIAPKKKETRKRETKEEMEMRMFREQMLILDSLTKTPEQRKAELEAKKEKERLEALRKKINEEKKRKVDVSKAGNMNTSFFNTIKDDISSLYIKAILDEEIKVVDGSRIRIRIMEDISVDGHLLEKGAYIYAEISGFGQQRVFANVETILVENQIFPVDLQIYDVDGIQGFYVPTSKFTEFTKQFGGEMAQGGGSTISIENNDVNSINGILYGLANRGVQSGSRAASKAARRNRAKLKYNTIIYLINPEQLK